MAETLAKVYNILASLVPVASEDFSTKHAFCLRTIRELVQKEEKEEASEAR